MADGPSTLRFLLEGRRSPAEYFLALARRHGDVVRLKGIGTDIHVVSHPDPAREVLQLQRDAFGRDDLVSRRMRMVFGNGLVINEGAAWARQRRLMQAFFTRPSAERHFDTIAAVADRTARRWDELAAAGRDVDVVEEMRRATLRILMTSLFSTPATDDIGRVETALQAGRDFIASPLPVNLPAWAPLPAYRRRRRTADDLNGTIDAMIEERRRASEPPEDLLTLLVRGDPETGAPPDHGLIVDEVRSMIAAGHVTLTAALSWFWHLMSRHTEHQAALRDELQSTLGEAPLTLDRIQRLPVTLRLLDETLRLYPPVWSIWRNAARDVSIGGHAIPAGASVLVCILAIHRHPGLWRNPDAFDPRRSAPAHELAFIPFGLGPRRCLGANLALLEMVALVASIARRFQLTSAGTGAPGLDARVALSPRGPVRVRVERA
jgi:cytochrome P450